MIRDKVITFIDLETTGGKASRDRVIEVGYIQYFNGVIISEYESLVNPNCELPYFISKITGIREEQLKAAPPFSEIMYELYENIRDTVIVAHNVNFDYGFLKAEFERHGLEFKTETVCSVKMSRNLFPEFKKHSLDSIIDRYGLACDRRHRALDDAKIIYDFFQIAIKKNNLEIFNDLFLKQIKATNLPVGINSAEVDLIPDDVGVYLFWGEDLRVPIFIGRSLNLKTKILSHFDSSKSETREFKIFQSTQRIEYVSANGELGAFLLQAELSSQLNPTYTNKVKRDPVLPVLKRKIYNGYCYPKKELLDDCLIEEVDSLIGVFNSVESMDRHLSKLCKEFKLCPNYMTGKFKESECKNFSVSSCIGPCAEIIPAKDYNKVFDEAFLSSRILAWPFNGYLMVKELNAELDDGDIFVFYKWSLVARGKLVGSMYEIKMQENASFDIDLYKVLKNYILRHQNYSVISELQLSQIVELAY